MFRYDHRRSQGGQGPRPHTQIFSISSQFALSEAAWVSQTGPSALLGGHGLVLLGPRAEDFTR